MNKDEVIRLWENYDECRDFYPVLEKVLNTLENETRMRQLHVEKCILKDQIIEKLKKSNEFYAEIINWESNSLYKDEIRIEDCELYNGEENEFCRYFYGGKLARQTQKEVHELEKQLLEEK